MKRIIAVIFLILLLPGCQNEISTSGNISPKTSVAEQYTAERIPSNIEEATAEPASSGSIECSEIPASSITDTPDESEVVSEPVAASSAIEFAGTINLDLNIHMSLVVSNDGTVKGTYFYNKYGTLIDLAGEIDENSTITINEYSGDGQIAGTFTGWYIPEIQFKGFWEDAKTSKEMPFDLKVLNGIPQDAIWAGEWMRTKVNRFYGSTLYIFHESGGQLEFDEIAINGGYSGKISGTAEIHGNQAVYFDGETGAALTFNLEPDSGMITLEANDSANSLAGAGVVFDGQYSKSDVSENFTLLSSGYLETDQQEKEFIAITGNDVELFLNTAQISSETDDLDDFGATVSTWWVRGIAPYNASIIMLFPDGTFCAAVNDLKNEIVKVYTNASRINEIPNTIKKWNENHLNWDAILING